MRPRAHTGGRPLRDLSGQEFGRLVVDGRTARPPGKYQPGAWWRCRCSGPPRWCVGEAIVARGSLVNGETRSCGCLRRELAAGKSQARKAEA